MSFHSRLMLLEAAYIKSTGWGKDGRRKVKPWDTSPWFHISKRGRRTEE